MTRVTRLADGSAAIEGLYPLHVAALIEVPELLERPDGDVGRRLFPEPSDDARQKDDWDRLVRPELFALLASAREIVLRDLKGLELALPPAGGGAGEDGPPEGPRMAPSWNVTVPAAHLHAWISALNAARLALGAQHGIETEKDLRPELEEKDGRIELNEKALAVIKIEVLAEIQHMLILSGLPESERPPLPEAEGPGEEEE